MDEQLSLVGETWPEGVITQLELRGIAFEKQRPLRALMVSEESKADDRLVDRFPSLSRRVG